MDRLLEIKEVANLLQVSERTVYRRMAEGALPRPIKVGWRSLMDVQDVVAYVERLKRSRGHDLSRV